MLKHFQRNSFAYGTVLIVLFLLSVGAARAIRDSGLRMTFEPETTVTVDKPAEPQIEQPVVVVVDKPVEHGTGWTVKEPAQAAEFVTGPLAADVGQLCVFRLNDPDTRADWVIVPEATCYVDSSGSSLAFASNIPSKYSIIAAVVEDGVPKILTHICEYGLQPQPDPGPNPDPTPKPNPPPKPAVTLKDWVSQNVPEAGKSKAAALASCYESAALGIENGSIRSQEAAYSVIRTASQTKINVETWSTFLDGLAEQIVHQLNGEASVARLGVIFAEIAEGLKAVSIPETISLAIIEEIVQPVLPVSPLVSSEKPTVICPDPTGRACQTQPTIQYRRSR